MKTKVLLFFIPAFLALGLSAAFAADSPKSVEKVLMKENQVWEGQGITLVPAVTNVIVANCAEVKTNGAFTVNNGKERQLLEGQIINSDGTLLSPDGSIMPIIDHIAMKEGKVLLIKDGKASVVSQTYTLGDGCQVQPDGFLVDKSGRRFKLLDGQLLKLDGAYLPVKDTALLRNGQVTVHKDGSLIPVGSSSNIMMNEGTKIYGDGRVVSRSGDKSRLIEGQVLILEGVVTRNR
jgi:hypothetical protein